VHKRRGRRREMEPRTWPERLSLFVFALILISLLSSSNGREWRERIGERSLVEKRNREGGFRSPRGDVILDRRRHRKLMDLRGGGQTLSVAVNSLRGGGQTLSSNYAFSYQNTTLYQWWNSTHWFNLTSYHGLGEIQKYFMLAGDIGGTNARLTIYAISPEDLNEGHVSKEVYGKKYKVRDFSSLAAVLDQFLRDAERDRAISLKEYLQIKSRRYPTTACFAVAGPVANNQVKFTNVKKWPIIRGTDLERQLGIQKVQLLNDFCALSEGVVTMEALGMCEQLCLQKQPIYQSKRKGKLSKLVIGAGTGLGECQLIWNGKHYQAWASEGGHVDFSPRDEEQAAMLDFMRKRYNTSQGGSPHVSVERFCSGQGIADIYEFLRDRYPNQVDPEANSEYERAVEKPVIVTEIGKRNKSSLMNKALEIFLDIFGSEVGNAALKFLPFGGIYLGGGIAPNLKEYIERSPSFLQAFRDKGRMSTLVRQIPVKLLLADGIAIRGAETVARRKLQSFLEDQL